jgi:carbon monoxide dehydrogenase subunit G
MARLELTILIDATPEQVWPVLADFEGQKRWMVDLRKLDITSDVKEGVGARMDVISELFGLPVVKDVMVVDYWQPPRIYSVIHKGHFSGTGYFELKPVGDATELTWVEDFRPPLGALGEVGFKLIVGPHLRRVFMRSLTNVKHLAEAAAASTTATAT